MVGGLAAFGVAAASSNVTVTVDGDASQVLSFGETVGDVLDAEDIEVSADDLVVPSLESPLQDGTQIEVAFARDVTVTVDGVTDDLTTTALSVEELLGELGLRDGAVTTTVSRSAGIGRDGFEVAIRTPKQVVIVDGDTRLPLVVTSTTVAEALESAGIDLGRRDEVAPAASTALSDGTTITVARFTTAKRTETSPVDFRTVTRETSDLFTDEEQVEQEGRVGERTRVYRVERLGGEKQGETLLSDEVTTPPVDRIVLVGTTPRPAPEPEPAPQPAPQPAQPASPSALRPPSPVARGTRWLRVSRGATGRSTRATATTAGFSSRRARGWPTGVGSTPRRRTWPAVSSRSRSRARCATPAAGTATGRPARPSSACRADLHRRHRIGARGLGTDVAGHLYHETITQQAADAGRVAAAAIRTETPGDAHVEHHHRPPPSPPRHPPTAARASAPQRSA